MFWPLTWFSPNSQRTPVKRARSSTSSRATPIAGPSSESKRHRRRESSSSRTKLSERCVQSVEVPLVQIVPLTYVFRNVSEEPTSPPPRDCSWEELEFYNAVKQRLKPDPLEEYEAKEREIAWVSRSCFVIKIQRTDMWISARGSGTSLRDMETCHRYLVQPTNSQ